MANMELEYFPCYHSYAKKLAKLSDQEVGRLFRSLLEYSETGETQELTGRESVAFDFIAYDIDRAREAYKKKCESNSENGKKGGRPKKRSLSEEAKKPTAFPETQKSQDKDKNKNKNKDKSEDEDPPKPPTPVESSVVAAVIADYCNRINPTASPSSLDELRGYAEELGEDVCKRAFDIALDAKITKWNYIRGILRNKLREGVRSLADWDALEEKRRQQKQGANSPGGYSYDDKGDSL